jgi:hypothetical protein
VEREREKRGREEERKRGREGERERGRETQIVDMKHEFLRQVLGFAEQHPSNACIDQAELKRFRSDSQRE